MKTSVFSLVLALILPVLSFGQSGIDPLRQEYVNGGNRLGVTPGNTFLSLSAAEHSTAQIPIPLGSGKIPRRDNQPNRPDPPGPNDRPVRPNVNANEEFRPPSGQSTTWSQIRGRLTNTQEDTWSYRGEADGTIPIFVNGFEFYPEGEIRFHRDTETVAGFYDLRDKVLYPSKYGDLHLWGWTSFHENGMVSFACPTYEERDFQIGQYTIPYQITAGGYLAKIFFHDNGNIEDIHINEPVRLNVNGNNILFVHHEGCGGDLKFYRDGSFKGGYLGEETLIDGIFVPKGAYVHFHPDGSLEAAMDGEWDEPVSVNGYLIGYPGVGGGFVLSEDGDLLQVLGFAEQARIYGETFYPGESMMAYEYDGEYTAYKDDYSSYFFLIDPDE